MGRVTLRDVAEASGVAPSTASFVLNATSGQSISEVTRERVQRAARELGYTPHGIARALREGSSRIVLLYLDSVLDGHYMESFIRGLDQELSIHGHVLLVKHGETPPEATRQVQDAIVPRAVLRVGQIYVPGRELEDFGGGWDDGLAVHATLQIGYLHEHGHRHIGLGLPDHDTPFAKVRLDFSNQAAERHGLEPLVPVEMPAERSRAGQQLARLRSRHPELTAIAGLDDLIACRVLAAARDIGVDVPGELAVIGFDASETGAMAVPALTTVRTDGAGHGRRMAQTLLGRDPDDIKLARGRVIVRESA